MNFYFFKGGFFAKTNYPIYLGQNKKLLLMSKVKGIQGVTWHCFSGIYVTLHTDDI